MPDGGSGQPDGSVSTMGDAALGTGSSTTITSKGGTLTITSASGDVTTQIVVPSGAVSGDTEVVIAPATLPSSAPSTVAEVTPGFQVDLGGNVLTTAAKARLRLPYNPTDGDLVILTYSVTGTTFIKYTIEMDNGATYAAFDVTQGGQYLAVRLVQKAGCDQTLPMAPSIAKQADVDALSNVRRIVGNVTISGTVITSLAALKCLQQVDGYVSISGTNVTSLDGLGELTFVGADNYYYSQGVTISSNSLLDSATLPSLLAISNASSYAYAGLAVQSNPVLTSVSADALNAASITFSDNGRASTAVSFSFKSLDRSPFISVTNNPSLKDIAGFGALTTVAGAVTINTNGVTSLDGFKLLEATGSVTISNNVALTSGAGLSKLASAAQLTFSTNQLLTSIPLTVLKTVSQATSTSASISVTGNSALKSFTAGALTEIGGSFAFTQNGNATDATVIDLSTLAIVGGSFDISQNLGLQTLDNLTALTTTGDFTIQSNAGLKSMAGLSKLDTVGNLNVSSNGKLADLGGLAKLTHASAVTVGSNAALTVAALPALSTLTQGLSVTSNAALTSFSADAVHVAPSTVTFTSNGTAGTPTQVSMAALSSVAGALTLTGNAGLVSMDGFGALVSVGGNVNISTNAALADVAGLSKLSTVTGQLAVSSNSLLANVNGLSSLSRATNGVVISSNAALSDVTLPALTSTSSLNVSQNAALANMTVDALTGVSGAIQFSSNGTAASVATTTISMAALTTVGQSLTISSNPKLKALSGFPMLSGIGGQYYVGSNVLLPTCSAVALRTQVLSMGAIGSSSISGNLSDGCMP